MVKIRIDGDTASFEKKLNDLGSIGEKALNGLKVAAVATGTALVALATYSLNVGMAFEAQMSTVQSISGATGKELDLLSAKAKEMGATTQFSATEAGQALEYMAMAGWKTEDMLSGLEGVMYAAGASGENLAMVSDIITDSLTAFGMSAGDASNMADVLAATASNANTTIAGMGETFKYAAPVAAAYGYSLEDISLATGLMANSSIKGAQAGTALRNIMTGLGTEVTLTGSAFGELTISTANADGTMVPFGDTLLSLRDAFGQMTESERAANAETIAGKYGMAGLLAIVSASDEEYNKLAAAIENSAGSAKRMNETRLDNLQGDVTILKSGFEGLGISIYESFNGSARDAVQGLQISVAKLNTELSKPDVRKAIESIGTAFASLVKTIGNMVSAVLPPFIKALGLVADNMDVILPTTLGLVAAFKLMSIIGTVTTAMRSMSTATAAAQVLMNASTKGVTAEVAARSMLTAALGKETALEAVNTAAKAAGLIVTEAKTLVTASGTTATAADTAAVLINSGAISAKTVLLGVLNGSISLTTAAQWLWNAAMLANPIGLVVAGVVSLTAVLVGLTIAFGKQNQELRQMQSDTKDAIAASNQLQDSMANNTASFQENTAEIKTNAGAAQAMADRLYDLAQRYHGSTTEMAKMQVLVEQLNAAVPGLSLEINKQTGQLNMNRAAVDALIASQKDQLIAQAKAARATELTEELIRQEESLRELNNQLQEWRDKLTAGEMSEHQFTVATKDLRNEIDEVDTSIKKTNEQIDVYTEESANAAIASEESATAFAYSEESLHSLADQYGTTVEAIRAATDGTVASLDTWVAAQEEAASAATEATAAMASEIAENLTRVADAYQNSNDRIDLSNATSLENRINNIAENQRLSDEYAANIAYLGEQVGTELDAGLLAELQRGDAEAMALAQQMVDSLKAGDEKWAELNSYYQNSADTAITTLAEGMTFPGENPGTQMVNEVAEAVAAGSGVIAEAATTAGSGAVEGLQSSITSGAPSSIGSNMVTDAASGVSGNPALQSASQATGQDAIVAITGAIESGDPVGIGQTMVDDITTGVSNSTPEFISTTETSATDAVEAAKVAASAEVTQPIGVDLITGIVNGVNEMQATLVSTAKTAVDQSVSAARGAGSSGVTHSIGADMVQGITNGVNAGASGVVNAMVSAVQQAISAAKAAAQIASPSKIMRREVGEMLGAGLALGIEDSTEDAIRAAENQMQDVVDAYEDPGALTLQTRFLAEFGDVPARFFETGRVAGEQFIAGFNLAAMGFMSMLENIIMGRPLMSVSVNENAATVRDVTINFNEPVDSPDATARSIKNVFEYGLAGERN